MEDSIIASSACVHEEQYRGCHLAVSIYAGSATSRIYRNGALLHYDSSYDFGFAIKLGKDWIDSLVNTEKLSLRMMVEKIETEKNEKA